jgi:hypothetical protein
VQIIIDYKGNPIRLTDERLEHILLHPEMIDLLESIKDTLVNPEYVIQSKQDDKVALYNKFYITKKFGGKYLCVVVKDNENDSFIITSFLINKLPEGVILWQRN